MEITRSILKLQNMFYFVIVLQQFQKTDESYFFQNILNECMEKPYRANLLSSEYNHHIYANAHALPYSFHELGDETSLVGIAVFLPNIVDYVGSLYGQ
jgi:hypothetical protein